MNFGKAKAIFLCASDGCADQLEITNETSWLMPRISSRQTRADGNRATSIAQMAGHDLPDGRRAPTCDIRSSASDLI
ncbi:hypothetical protein, partial [Bradyrhizobium sp. ORS 375]|uniref:hypothetical protein n=1 Tax=Bradyrhizobium sp. (strain ORS 375) TaxID=566679 RepID=UPI001AEC1199